MDHFVAENFSANGVCVPIERLKLLRKLRNLLNEREATIVKT
jgi:hypothetical protein